MSSLGVWIVGAAGHVGTCTLVGWAALGAGLVRPTGLVTAAGPIGLAPLVGWGGVRFGGHEVRDVAIADTARALAAEGILPAAVIDAPAVQAALAEAQAALRPGLAGPGGWAELERVRGELDRFRALHRLDRIVVLNVASTEADPDAARPTDPDGLFAALRAGARLPASAIYAAAALDLGLAYVNFTPSTGSDLPALHALALARGAVHAGADGKTGQTLLKTVLAPMFAIRRLQVKSWISHNLLGNEDGRTLDDPTRRAAKQRSKIAPLAAILGYEPESRVGIEYVPSYGDWKVAWDRIVFEGFGGAEMSLELTWRGSDTALAAPLCIDLIRLAELAQRRGERGVLGHLALFFKRPLGVGEHRLERQWQALLDHVGAATASAAAAAQAGGGPT
jgi:myo-inositol-1-phosphate synthase